MSRYLLPCECGQTIPVSTAAAGTEVECTCGKRIKVPSIRGLRDFAKEASHKDAKPITPASDSSPWNMRGVVFVLGLFLLCVGIGVAGWNGFLWSQVDTRDDHREQLQYSQSQIDQLTPVQLFDTWNYISKQGLGEYETPAYQQRRAFSNACKQWLIGGSVLMAAGIAAMTYALLTGPAVRRST